MAEPDTRTRRPGRPRKSLSEAHAQPLLSRAAVVEAAYLLCDTTRLEDLTLNQIAAALGVSTTTVRHHIKTRRALTKLLIDRYFHDLRERLPAPTGDWTVDLDNYLWAHATINSHKPGFASYMFEHRFGPEIAPFGTADAMFVSQRMLSILRGAGLGPDDAALAWHATMHLLLSIGYAQAHGQTPSDQIAAFDRIGADADGAPEDQAIIAAMSRIDLPMIYGTLANMVKDAIARGFDFGEAHGGRDRA